MLTRILVICAVLLALQSASGREINLFAETNANTINRPVLNQHGQTLDFYRDLVQGKIVVINFIFSRCTATCPLSTAVLRQTQKKLTDGKVQFISISVDPVNDTPEHLLTFSQKFGAEKNWSFVTGEKQQINSLLKELGAFTANPIEHSNMVVIGSDTLQRWTRLYGLPQAGDIISVLNGLHAKR